MTNEAIDYDNATEEELAALRGDNLEETQGESQDAPAVEEEAEPPVVEDKQAPVTADEGADKTEPEVESEGESPAAAQAEEEEPPTFMIPKSRYDAVMARLREAEAKNQQPEAAQPVREQPQQDPVLARMAEIDAEVATAVQDGDGQKAASLMAESRELQNQMFQQQLAMTSQSTSAQAIEQVKYDTLVEQVERFVPAVNPDGDAYDEGMVLEVQELMEAFQAKGHASSEALIRALNYVSPGWDDPNAKSETQSKDEGEVDAASETPKPAPKKTEVAKNVADAKATPPVMDAGVNSDEAGIKGQLDVMKLPDEEFEKLTEAQLAEFRGDNF